MLNGEPQGKVFLKPINRCLQVYEKNEVAGTAEDNLLLPKCVFPIQSSVTLYFNGSLLQWIYSIITRVTIFTMTQRLAKE